MTTWALTVAGNLSLAVLMLWRGHYLRYRVLFVSLVLECFAAPCLHWIYMYYGTSSAAYLQAFWLMKAVEFIFSLAIVWETRKWPKIGIPYELYALALLCLFIVRLRHGHMHDVNEAMRTIKLLGLAWLTFGMSIPLGEVRQNSK